MLNMFWRWLEAGAGTNINIVVPSDVGYTRSDGTYVVNDKESKACILAYFKSQATIYFSDTKGNYKVGGALPAVVLGGYSTKRQETRAW